MSRRGRQWSRAWNTLMGHSATETAVLVLVILGLAGTMAATLRVGMSAPTDLAFTAARLEVSSIIQAQGDSGLAAPRRALDTRAGRPLLFDSLALVGDSLAIPSLARGGFLRDEIEAFNESATRNAWLPTLLGRTDLPDAESPSLFRLARDDSGAKFLSARLNPFILTVQSPRPSAVGIVIRASDWHEGPSVVGLRGEASLATSLASDTARVPMSYSNCRMTGKVRTRHLLFCGVSPGITLDTGYDIRVDGKLPNALDGSLELRENRRAAMWSNGQRITLPGKARAGDLLYTTRMGPALLSEVETGRLAGPQWVNGRESLFLVPTGTQRWFGRAARSVPPARGNGPLELSIDAALTTALDKEIAAFMTVHRGFLEAMSVLVVDLSTGRLRSIAESNPSDEKPLMAFEPILLGSMSKPLIAAAILSRQPELAKLSLVKSGTTLGEVAGLRLHSPLGNPDNRCPDTITFDTYLQCSSNHYAAELLLSSLQTSAGESIRAPDGRVADAVLESSALTEGLLSLYDDVVLTADAPLTRSSRLWQRAGVDRVPRDQALLPYLSRPWLDDPRTEGVQVDWLARYAIGGWENRWTLVGALEAYARIATDKRVQLTLHEPTAAPAPSAPRVPPEAAFAYRAVRRGMQLAAQRGTAVGLDAAWRDLASAATPLVVLAKTGTLNEDAEQSGDKGVFLKALAISVGKPESDAEGAALKCGLGMIVYLQFRQDWREIQRLNADSKLPDLHRAFATNELAQTLRDYWKRRDPCVIASPGIVGKK